MAHFPYRSADFIQDVRSLYTAVKPETFWACEAAVGRLLANGLVADWFNERLRALTADPQYVGEWLPNEVVLHRGTGWVLSVALLDSPLRYIHALPFYAMYAPLDPGGLAYDLYRLPVGYRNDVFDPSVRLEPLGTRAAREHEVIRLQSDQYALDFKVSRPVPVLRFITQPLRSMEWLFSKGTLQAWQANDADLSFTQLRVAAYVLGKIAHQSSIGPLRRLASHPHHAVRWAAIQNLGRLNRSEALVKIREAVNDPHPHVRRAAQKTLDRLDHRSPK